MNKKLMLLLMFVPGLASINVHSMDMQFGTTFEVLFYPVKYAAQATTEHAIKPLLWATAGAVVLALSKTTAEIILTPPSMLMHMGWDRISGKYAATRLHEKTKQNALTNQLIMQQKSLIAQLNQLNTKSQRIVTEVTLKNPKKFQQWAIKNTIQIIQQMQDEGLSQKEIIKFLEAQGLPNKEAQQFFEFATKNNTDISPTLDDSQGLEASNNAS